MSSGAPERAASVTTHQCVRHLNKPPFFGTVESNKILYSARSGEPTLLTIVAVALRSCRPECLLKKIEQPQYRPMHRQVQMSGTNSVRARRILCAFAPL